MPRGAPARPATTAEEAAWEEEPYLGSDGVLVVEGEEEEVLEVTEVQEEVGAPEEEVFST